MADLQIVPLVDAPGIPRIDPHKRYLGMAEAGYSTGLSKAFIHQKIMTGELPAYRVGRRLLIDIDDLDAFIRQVPA